MPSPSARAYSKCAYRLQRQRLTTAPDDFITSAQFGLFGSDNLRVAVSPDGSAFNDAIEIDEATGIVDLPSNPKFSRFTDFDNYITTSSWTTIGINNTDYNDQSRPK